ncbi:hypothetical protein BGX26_005898, partial [Mortierella sp. AD094]
AKDPVSDNLIFWHNGGSGCSSMDGMFDENGPHQTKDEGQTWQINPQSWHNLGCMVYIDQSFGTGFSKDNVTTPI